MKAIIGIVFAFTVVAWGEKASVKVGSLRVDGREYDGAIVTVEDRFSARIVHSSGISRIPTVSLPEEIQKQLGLIPKVDSPSPPITDVSVRTISVDSVKFNEIFGSWQFSRNVPPAEMTVLQDLGATLICSLASSDESIAVVGDFDERADGSHFRAPIADTGKLFSYITVLGAPRKIKMFEVVHPPTEADFLVALKAGKTFLIPDTPAKNLCDACGGKPTKCGACNSTGTVTVARQMRIRW